MTGKAKYAQRMTGHVGEPIDAACPITRTGGTAGQIGANVGGAIGAAIGTTGSGGDSDVEIGQFGWLGLGADHLTLTNSSAMGKPTGEPLARVAYADVTQAVLTPGKVTLRADLDLKRRPPHRLRDRSARARARPAFR